MEEEKKEAQYKLFYHDGPYGGRGEPVRTMLELCGVSYEDTARGKHLYGPAAIRDYVRDVENSTYPVLFPPMLIDCVETVTVNQMPNILQYLGEKHGFAGANLVERTHALQIALTWNDLLTDACAAYHPIDHEASYESQKEAAIPHIEKFLEARLPKFLGYLEECLRANDGGAYGYMVGAKISFADVCMLNMLRGYKGSAPEHYESNASIPLLKQLEARIREEPRIKAFLASDRTATQFVDSFC